MRFVVAVAIVKIVIVKIAILVIVRRKIKTPVKQGFLFSLDKFWS